MTMKRTRRHRRVMRKKASGMSAKKRAMLKWKAQNIASSIKAPLRAYKKLEKKIDKTWQKLRFDVKNRSRSAIIKGCRDLQLLLGECNYMAHECARCLKKR